MSITAKVTKETYRVYPAGVKWINAITASSSPTGKYIPAHPAEHVDHESMMDAIFHALRIAGEGRCDIIVDRVTHHEPVTEEMAPNDLFGTLVGRTETLTGELYLSISTFRNSPELSRYNPVNGWVIPETIEIT